MAKRIPLTQGKFALIDDEDFEELDKYKWHYNSHGYAYRHTGGGRKITKTQSMHSLIYGRYDILIDHKDGDGLNNCRDNLRPADKSLNAANSKIRIDNTSGYRGVFKDKKRNTYYAQIQSRGKVYNLGTFNVIEYAARAYDKAALVYFGEFARLNNV